MCIRDSLEGLTRAPLDPVALSRQWLKFVEESGKEAAVQRRQARLVLRLLIDFLDDALTVSLGGSPRRTEPEDRPALEALAGRTGPDVLLAALEALLDALAQRLKG